MSIKLYNLDKSGHSHRIRLMLSFLELEYERHDVDLGSGEQKSDAFLEMNPFGHVPVLEDDGITIYDSTAILVYLAKKYDTTGKWLPSDPLKAAQVQQWLSAASGEIAFGPATARLVTVFGASRDHEKAKAIAHAFFKPLNTILADREFLTGSEITIADVAGYSYIAHAPEGDVDLEPYANIRAWLGRIESQPGFVPMTATSVALAA